MRHLKSAVGAGLAAQPTHASQLNMALGAGVSSWWWYPIWSTTACGGTLFGMDYQDLLWINSNGTINGPQSVAQSISVSKSDTVVDVHINPRWKWSNGTPVTAQDVVFQFQAMKASAATNAPWAACGLGIGGMSGDFKSVVALNQDTVQISTPQSVNPSWFELNGISQLTPVPAKVWDSIRPT